MKKKIPVHIITGFLGSGKTTFLNHFLKSKNNERIVVIENEIGKINIDGATLVTNTNDIIELTAGCICCSLNDELFDVLEELYVKKDEIDRILIETTGIADPGAIAATFLNHPAVIKDFELINVIGVMTLFLLKAGFLKRKRLSGKLPHLIFCCLIKQTKYPMRQRKMK